MDAFILLADSAVDHPDGTFSLLRGGINSVSAAGEPVLFRGALIARIKATVNEAGDHPFALKCTNLDGGQVIPPLQGGFVVPDMGGEMHFVLNFSFKLPKFGRYVFALLIDNQERDTWKVTATKAGQAPQGEHHR